DLAQSDQRPTLAVQTKCGKVAIVKTGSGFSHLLEQLISGCCVTTVNVPIAIRQEKISLLNAIFVSLEQSRRPREPSACLSRFTAKQQRKPEPERTSDCR